MAKRGGFIYEMFEEIASREELSRVQDLFKAHNYGGAETFMLRRIKKVFDELLHAVSKGYKTSGKPEKEWFENNLMSS